MRATRDRSGEATRTLKSPGIAIVESTWPVAEYLASRIVRPPSNVVEKIRDQSPSGATPRPSNRTEPAGSIEVTPELEPNSRRRSAPGPAPDPGFPSAPHAARSTVTGGSSRLAHISHSLLPAPEPG
jgi:hypothetical protein